MKKIPYTKNILLSIICLLFVDIAFAQAQQGPSQRYRAEESWYLKGRIGGNVYGGDRDVNPENEIQTAIEQIGFSFGLEAGYQFTERFSLGLMHLSGIYPKIDENRDGPPHFPLIDKGTSSEWRHHLNLVARTHITPRKQVSPYGQLGVNVSFGTINDELKVGYGPTAGFGLDAAIDKHWGLFLELDGVFTFDDEALDNADPGNFGSFGDASDFDAFGQLLLGVRYTVKAPPVPVEVMCEAVDTPQLSIMQGESATFAATTNPDATQPVEVSWNFGDGETASGLLATHVFNTPGTYAVTVTAQNRINEISATCRTVEVKPPPPPAITRVMATPKESCDYVDVNFSSTVTGTTTNLVYKWSFGDNTPDSNQARPSHRYMKPMPPAGTEPGAPADTTYYTATLDVSNTYGRDDASLRVAVPSFVDLAAIEFAQVCFNNNESILGAVVDSRFTPADEKVMTNLESNLRVLRNNPGVNIRIEGFASPNERNAQSLAEDRARAIRDYYVNGGVSADRITVVGTVLPTGPKKRPICTRTITLPCVDKQ